MRTAPVDVPPEALVIESEPVFGLLVVAAVQQQAAAPHAEVTVQVLRPVWQRWRRLNVDGPHGLSVARGPGGVVVAAIDRATRRNGRICTGA